MSKLICLWTGWMFLLLIVLCVAPVKHSRLKYCFGGAVAAMHLHASTLPTANAVPLKPQRGKKCALLIAISDYQNSAWVDLNTANNVRLWNKLLNSKRYAFDVVESFVDRTQTREEFFAILRDFVASHLERNDQFHLHFSGHGSSVKDLSGEELDSLDEVLVMGGAGKELRENDFVSDDDLGAMLYEIRRTLGPNGSLYVTVDACYSGSITRSLNDQELMKAGMQRDDSYELQFESFSNDIVNRSERNTSRDRSVTPDELLAPFVIFTAASHAQVSQEISRRYSGMEETNSYGPLTYSLCSILESLNRKISCRELLRRVRRKFAAIRPNQTPQLEGHADLTIFDGDFIPSDSYYVVLDEVKDRPLHYLVEGGGIHGMAQGAFVKIQDSSAEIRDSIAHVTNGMVVEASTDRCIIITSEPLPDVGKKEYRVFVDVHSFHNAHLDIVKHNIPASIRDELIRSLLFVQTKDSSGLGHKIDINWRNDSLYIVDPLTSTTIDVIDPDDSDWTTQLKERLVKVLRNKHLLDLESADRDLTIQVDLEFLPVSGTSKWTHSPDEPGATFIRDRHGNFRMRGGQKYHLKAVNRGSDSAWVHVFQLQANGEMRSLFPAYYKQSELLPGQDNMLRPGQEHVFTYHSFDYRRDVEYRMPFKRGVVNLIVFATPRPYNFSAILGTKEYDSNGSAPSVHPLLQVLQLLYKSKDAVQNEFDNRFFGMAKIVSLEII